MQQSVFNGQFTTARQIRLGFQFLEALIWRSRQMFQQIMQRSRKAIAFTHLI
jgi:hypothetical protein